MFTYEISYLNLQRYQMKLYALALFSSFNSIIIIWDELARFALRELNVNRALKQLFNNIQGESKVWLHPVKYLAAFHPAIILQ